MDSKACCYARFEIRKKNVMSTLSYSPSVDHESLNISLDVFVLFGLWMYETLHLSITYKPMHQAISCSWSTLHFSCWGPQTHIVISICVIWCHLI